MNKILFKIIYPLIWLLTLLPLPILYLLSDVFYFITFYIAKYRKKVVISNLKNSFPEKSDKEINKITKRFYAHLCDNLLETMALINMSEKEIKKRFLYKNIEVLDDLYSKNKSVCAVFGHYANWDWMASLPLHTKYKVYSIYMPIKNRQIDKLTNNLRSKYGLTMIHKQYSVRTILDLHKSNELFLTYFIGDQTPSRREINYWTTFLNQDTAVFLGTERIAKKTNQAVVYFDIKRIKRGYYEIELINLYENPKETVDYEITEKHLRILENRITENPEYWLWSHKRWKHKKVKN